MYIYLRVITYNPMFTKMYKYVALFKDTRNSNLVV